MKKIKIQFLGTFIYYKMVQLDSIEKDYFMSIANRLGYTLNEALVDPYFYHLLRLEKYQSFKDLKGASYFGLDIHSFHQIELFVNGLKKQKFNYFDLNPEIVLFPLYYTNVKYNEIQKNPLIIRTREKGCVNYVSQCSLETPIDEILAFTLLKTQSELLLSEVLVNKINLDINRSDTTIIEQFVMKYHRI